MGAQLKRSLKVSRWGLLFLGILSWLLLFSWVPAQAFSQLGGYTCAACHQERAGVSSRTYEGRQVCPECEQASLPRCFICKIPIRGGGLHFSDGRRNCDLHSQRVVTTQSEVERYFREAWSLIARYVSPQIKCDPDLTSVHIVDYNLFVERLRLSGKAGESRAHGLTLTINSGGFVTMPVSQVFVLQGLPDEHALSVIVHECGHVWQNANLMRPLDKTRNEGFCQWLSYKVNQGLGRRQQMAELLARRDPYYGVGLQVYLQLEKQLGIEGLLDYALGRD